MKTFRTIFSLITILLTVLSGCKKQSYDYPSAQLTDYLQLAPGKYITYRLDSLEFTNFGTQTSTVSFQAMDVIDTIITDNLGRPTWRVNRFLSDTTGTQPWVFNETYMITATRTDVEVVENNLRFIKLVLPILNGYNWPGNSYIDTNVPVDTSNGVNTDPDLSYFANWNYTYDSVAMPCTTLGGLVPNSITIDQQSEFYGDSTNQAVISGENYSVEV